MLLYFAGYIIILLIDKAHFALDSNGLSKEHTAFSPFLPLRVLFGKSGKSVAFRSKTHAFGFLSTASSSGFFPYAVYNPSIVRLPRSTWQHLCLSLLMNCDQMTQLFAVSWFSKLPGQRWGCFNWLGITTTTSFVDYFQGRSNDKFWVVPPQLIYDVKGPSFQDPRLLIVNADGVAQVALIGYVKLAPRSSVKGMADYSVRMSFLSAGARKACKCNIADLDVDQALGCFPQRLQCCVPDLNKKGINGSLFFDCIHQQCSSVQSHKSRHFRMPTIQQLSGVEVEFRAAHSTNNRIPRKNVVPVLFDHDEIPAEFAVFADFSPSDSIMGKNETPPLFTAVDVYNGNSLAVWQLDITNPTCEVLGSNWRGSTQLIPYEKHTYITIVHRTFVRTRRGRHYKYKLVLVSPRYIAVSHKLFFLPATCVVCIDFNENQSAHHNTFIFVTGLASFPEMSSNSSKTFLYSFGIGDKRDGFEYFEMIQDSTHYSLRHL